ncbi:protein adenylyltransferase SelO-like isoform X2 [Crotalus tigris]|uniref:protein adenylyltransferase SelO-like isoform X2 n=1 Tax=Crotalus tigris TaxID=88082 RepID=UPI00192F85FB|nr:protein adenylyltransferase SelO-like isoform X2 [Crotalus tigris]
MSGCWAVLWWFSSLTLVYHSGCYLIDTIAATSFNHMHNYINASNLDQDYCEKKVKLTNLDEWKLSTEMFTATLPIDHIQENYVREVQDCIFSVGYPTPFKSRVLLVAVSEEVLEDILDLDMSVSGSDGFLQFVSGSKIILGSLPLTHRYGGHQFGSWAGQLGDGRAHLIGIYTNRFGSRWELQLKGSGRTPYSRRGDGRTVLRSSIREFLGSEAMHYLGIPTSRVASLVVSDDNVWRDQFYNGNIKKERGAVVLRIAKSWFRIGSLEILAHSGELDLLRMLLDMVIKEHFPKININDSNKYLAFFSQVVSETAHLIALWMSVGFAHGVCNTDNFSLLSITIDYGPFGFMDAYDPDFVPNTSDDEGRYNIGNQANVGIFNLNKLLKALNPLFNPRQKQFFLELFKTKLGLLGENEDDDYLIAFLLKLMEDTRADFTMTFWQLGEISENQLKDRNIPKEFWALQDVAKHKNFSTWIAMYFLRLKRNIDDSDYERRRRMSTVNPRYVLRNWMAESAVQKAEINDFSEVRFLQQVLQHPFQVQALAERAGYAQRPPAWAKDVKVSCSS